VEEFSRKPAAHPEDKSGYQGGGREEEIDHWNRQSDQRHAESDRRSERSSLQTPPSVRTRISTSALVDFTPKPSSGNV
jgi:hypothetical protein